MSSREGFVPSERAALGLGMAGVDGSGKFSLKISGVGQTGRGGG